ncbi:uncharacterized protein LOC123695634 [Colias croceus]|uniref:uncharacterized protein LOC123695634 n=1 Tax=Colias crocea TaxID=72248 RepID=UPI001E27B784|nr:uncharacterized protein LOC123695634 [Colias croceus]
METLLDKFKREQGGLRRSRSVRASLRLIGNRWRSKDEEPDLKRDQVLFPFGDKEYGVAYAGVDGTYRAKTPVMAKRKQEPPRVRKKSGDVDLMLKPQRPKKTEKKFSDLFNKKQKSVSAKDLLVPEKIPPKAAAILHIHSPDKGKKKLKVLGKSETALVPEARRRTRRGSDGDMCAQARGCVNHAFVYSTPPKDRKHPLSPSAFIKLQYGALLEGCGGELPSLSACAPHPHLDKRKKERPADKIAAVNIHLQALFAAVEHGYLDKARNILESTDVDVNSVNTDGLSPLDVAVLTGNRPLAKMLMEFGAKEGNQFKSPEALGAHLRRLCREAEARLHDATPDRTAHLATRSSASGQAGTTGCAGSASEKDKQAQHWDRRHRTLKRLVSGWGSARVAGCGAGPTLEVEGGHAVTVRLADVPAAHSAVVTKYRVEWSSRADFSNVCGTREVPACSLTGKGGTGGRVVVSGLTRGRRYFFRVSAGNLKGWGPSAVSVPRSVVPSSWRDVSTRPPRPSPSTAAERLDALAAAAATARCRPTPPPPARPPRKTAATIRQLFTANTKFQKNLRRGVYLACVLYHEDKVLMTGEDFLPVVEVDETYPACIYTDFHWLMKVSCAWEEVKALRGEMERHSGPSAHFRLKLLAAAAQLQSALALHDLGQVYPWALRDAHGTLVLSLVGRARGPKLPALNARWAPAARLRRRPLSDDDSLAERLLASVRAQLAFSRAAGAGLARGLYAGYLKLQSSVDAVRLVAPAHAPAAPPHQRVRDNPHVSAEEWEYLRSQSGRTEDNQAISNLSINSNDKPSESQQIFLEQIATACRKLLRDMDVSADNALAHRIYDLEVIELNSDVTFIMICPPAEQACSVPGQKEMLLQRGDLLSLPIQAFEMIHMQTYHPDILHKYCKLSCILELDIAMAAHSHREAFSCTELQTTKEKLTKLEELQNSLNLVWKSERWLMDLISFARDKDKAGPNSGILLKYILEKTPSQICSDTGSCDKDVNLKIDLLQIPCRDGKITKTSPGRGSWPGPAGNGNHANLHPEFSKSEQQLSIAPRQASVSTLNLSSSQYLTDSKFARKGSADSQYTQSSAMSNNFMSSNSQFDVKSTGTHTSNNSNRLPPSRSEDTLVLQNENIEPKPRPHSINTTMSTTSSPLLTVKHNMYSGSMISVRTGNESAQSLSSDSESQSCPKLRPPNYRTVMPSKSMTNVKSPEIDFTDTGQEVKSHSVKRQPLLETQEEDLNKKVPKTEEKQDSEERTDPTSERRIVDQPGILQVFAAYETGLAAGTSLKLHVTPRTTAREVIDLVVKQLNMAAVLKGKPGPVYPPERLQDFCLVAVIGARERCLRDDFRPLQLQNPWRRGRLYVRLKHDVLAAIQHSAKQPAYI